jgi:hypothetical protein
LGQQVRVRSAVLPARSVQAACSAPLEPWRQVAAALACLQLVAAAPE